MFDDPKDEELTPEIEEETPSEEEKPAGEQGEEVEAEAEADSDGEPEGNEEEEDTGFDISLGGEEPEPKPSVGVKQLRKVYKEKSAELKEKDAKLKAAQEEIKRLKGEEAPIEVGKKPTMEDVGYDADEYERQYDAWKERKAQADKQKEAQQAVVKAREDAFNQRVQQYRERKEELSVPDFDEAEDIVSGKLTVEQQGIVVRAAKKSADFVYALSKFPKQLEELSNVNDPVEFAALVGRTEAQLQIKPKQPRKRKPAPTDDIAGSTGQAVSADETLKRLQARADETGDRTELVKYKRSLRK